MSGGGAPRSPPATLASRLRRDLVAKDEHDYPHAALPGQSFAREVTSHFRREKRFGIAGYLRDRVK
jgi:hypothetical protein